MEVGWYLRLSRASRVEVLVSPGSVPSLEEQRAICPSWSLVLHEEGGVVRAVFAKGRGNERS